MFFMGSTVSANPLIDLANDVKDKEPLDTLREEIKEIENEQVSYSPDNLNKEILDLYTERDKIQKETGDLELELEKKEEEKGNWESRDNLQKKVGRIVGGGLGFVIGLLGSVFILRSAWRK